MPIGVAIYICVYKSSLIYQCGKFISSRKNISELCVLIVNFCHVKKYTYSGIKCDLSHLCDVLSQ